MSEWRAPSKAKVKLLFLDCDGTLTDGVITFDSAGRDGRAFWIRDGIALEWARASGMLPVVISGRASNAVVARMEDLGLEHYVGIKDKVGCAEGILKRENLEWTDCAMIGDDLPDVPLMKRVAWSIAVADAVPEVIEIAHSVTVTRAGCGAVREAVQHLMKHNGTWQDVLARYEVT